MKIQFICTAHNSLSQRLFLALAKDHEVSVEYALSDSVIIEAVGLYQPDLIICPFLTARIPREVYAHYLTLIVHPGPPGDVGPSALDWVLMGDDGSETESNKLLKAQSLSDSGREYWGVTILQAIEEFDAGPVWAFEQFPIDIDDPHVTKSTLYRSSVTQAAVTATVAAVGRITANLSPSDTTKSAVSPHMVADPSYRELSVTDKLPFQGGTTRHRPLLKAAQRAFNVNEHTAKEISRRITCSDSQPGCLSTVFGPSLYVYGGIIEEGQWVREVDAVPGAVIASRNEAVCIATCDKKGVWITHLRRLKGRNDAALWPKVPATTCLQDLKIMSHEKLQQLNVPTADDWSAATYPTLQEIWVEFATVGNSRLAYVFSEFYNGAMSSSQCSRLIAAFEFVLSKHTEENPLTAVVMMGGTSYFSNGIHLNVIETAADPALESWININAINDVVFYILHEFPKRNISTVAGVRGNCAAGGVAFAAAFDKVIAGSEVVLNPAYRALGLYGSEYHTLSYYKRCGSSVATSLVRDMLPLSSSDGERIGLVDYVVPGRGAKLTEGVRNKVAELLESNEIASPKWKVGVDFSLAGLTRVRVAELAEMAKDFWSPRASRYHNRRFAFVRKVKPSATPVRFATHRRQLNGKTHLDEEEKDEFDLVETFERKSQQAMEAQSFERLVQNRGIIFPCLYETPVTV
uniref:Formyl transferase C-terminal domain-containing protein n=1 Tax=Bionectria ochroleuca TaxID=29856 RepID=A0A8H7NIB2_BIOOC